MVNVGRENRLPSLYLILPRKIYKPYNETPYERTAVMSQEKKTIVINANAKQVVATSMIVTTTVFVTTGCLRVAAGLVAPQLHKLNHKIAKEV